MKYKSNDKTSEIEMSTVDVMWPNDVVLPRVAKWLMLCLMVGRTYLCLKIVTRCHFEKDRRFCVSYFYSLSR